MRRDRIQAVFHAKHRSAGYIPDETYTLDTWVENNLIWIQARENPIAIPYTSLATWLENWTPQNG